MLAVLEQNLFNCLLQTPYDSETTYLKDDFWFCLIFFYHEQSTHLLKHLVFITLTLSVEKTTLVSQRQKLSCIFFLQVDPVINAGY